MPVQICSRELASELPAQVLLQEKARASTNWTGDTGEFGQVFVLLSETPACTMKCQPTDCIQASTMPQPDSTTSKATQLGNF